MLVTRFNFEHLNLVFDGFHSLMASAPVSYSRYLKADKLRFGEAMTVENPDLFEQSTLAALCSPWHTRVRAFTVLNPPRKLQCLISWPKKKKKKFVMSTKRFNSPSMRIFTTFTSLLACSFKSCSIFELFILAFLLSSVISCGRHIPMQI